MGNDVVYITAIFSFFIILGTLIPFINAEFNEEVTDYNIDQIETIVGETVQASEDNITTAMVLFGIEEEDKEVKLLDIIFSIFSVFFFTFGALPLLLDLVLLIPRVILGLLIYRQIRSGAG